MKLNFLITTAEILGISSVDIKQVEMIYDRDAYLVTTWNRRKLILSGLQVHNYYRNKPP